MDRTTVCIRLLIRVLFFFPRFTFRIFITSTEVFSDKVIKNFRLILKLVNFGNWINHQANGICQRLCMKKSEHEEEHEEVCTDTLPHYS